MENQTFTACQQDNRPSESAISSEQQADFRVNFNVMLTAFIVGIGLMGLKFCGYWITGSSAILSDALESIINVVASGFGLGSVVVSAKPADASHPYGHGKIEFFAAGFEGALILFAAVGIFIEGMKQILDPQDLPRLGSGLFFLLMASVGNLVLGLVILRTGKRTKSLVLEADGKHLLTDVYTSGAVLVGLVLVYVTGWFRFDGIIACLAGLNIVFWGVKLVRQGFGELMHTSDPELLDEICDLLSRHKKDIWIDIHQLRSWRSGKTVHVDFHLILPKELTLDEGHSEVKELEAIFDKHFKGMSDLLIHLDPCLEPECPVCGHDPCDMRREARIHEKIWNRQALTRQAAVH
ncbi:MAG TPA: cation diffusion facilitator family transporter [Desulfomonilaceae bacterium]|nr:cation diffusion facilitator family transporter [Desulfomonilaceae bacterium]